MKKIFIFIVTFLIGVLIIVGYGILRKNPGKSINSIVETITKPAFTIDKAPTQTINGGITQITGDVTWESRIATESSPIALPLPIIQQGELIQTKENGQINLEFANAVAINIMASTQVEFVQTLPTEFVVRIASGSANFKKLSETPVSVRSYHLLIKQNSGEISIGVDTDNGFTNLNIISGSITVAYNDLDLNSHVIDFNSGQRVSFNDLTRTF